MTEEQTRFNPSQHLRKIERRQRQPDGSYLKVANNYLDVKWRIVWFRGEHPGGSIQTDLLSEPGVSPAVVKATVTLENGVSATGFGQSGAEDWGDWLEKAETRSIGRALALLGYGTQFCDDFDDIIADAPSGAPQRRQTAPHQREDVDPETGEIRPQRRNSAARAGMTNPDSPMTPNQKRYIESLARDTGLDDVGLEQVAQERYGVSLELLNKAQASGLIEALQAIKDDQSLAGFEI